MLVVVQSAKTKNTDSCLDESDLFIVQLPAPPKVPHDLSTLLTMRSHDAEIYCATACGSGIVTVRPGTKNLPPTSEKP